MEQEHRKVRTARFTSSQIVALTKFKNNKWQAPALTYIDEKRMESKMGCSLNSYAYSRAGAWGNFMEIIAYDFMDMKYKMVSSTPVCHPNPDLNPYWSGACDFIVEGIKISELKCYYKKKFAQYTECLMAKDLPSFRKNFAQEYWQIVSNCILNEVDYGEAVSFMPSKKHHNFIREVIENLDSPDQWKYRFIAEQEPWELPFLPDNSGYDNITFFEFKVPQDDIDFLTERVYAAIEELKKYQN